MLRFIVRRLLWSIPVLLIASILVFTAIRATTDPVAAAARNPHTTPQALARYEHDLGLDKSAPQQYVIWLSHFVRGDLGASLVTNGPVWPDLRSALVNSLVLGFFATAIAIAVGVAIGVVSAIKQYSIVDHLSSGIAFLGLSMPTFWFALILIVLTGTFYETHFHSANPLLPSGGLYSPGHSGFSLADRVKHLILPGIVLAVQVVAQYSRYMRANMLEVLSSDYMRTARAKGISERRVIVRHAMRNALIPLATFTAIDIGSIAGGLIVTEFVFSYPGMGQYFVNAFQAGDYRGVLPWMMIVMIFVIVFNLLADLSYAWLDPRIRID